MASILSYQKGDEITRIKPSKKEGDRSYIGDKLIFERIENGIIYAKCNKFKISSEINLIYDEWKDGWSYYHKQENIKSLVVYNNHCYCLN